MGVLHKKVTTFRNVKIFHSAWWSISIAKHGIGTGYFPVKRASRKSPIKTCLFKIKNYRRCLLIRYGSPPGTGRGRRVEVNECINTSDTAVKRLNHHLQSTRRSVLKSVKKYLVSAGHTPTSNSLIAWLHLSTIVIIGRRLTILFVLIGIENIIRLGKIGSRHLANIRDLQPIG